MGLKIESVMSENFDELKKTETSSSSRKTFKSTRIGPNSSEKKRRSSKKNKKAVELQNLSNEVTFFDRSFFDPKNDMEENNNEKHVTKTSVVKKEEVEFQNSFFELFKEYTINELFGNTFENEQKDDNEIGASNEISNSPTEIQSTKVKKQRKPRKSLRNSNRKKNTTKIRLFNSKKAKLLDLNSEIEVFDNVEYFEDENNSKTQIEETKTENQDTLNEQSSSKINNEITKSDDSEETEDTIFTKEIKLDSKKPKIGPKFFKIRQFKDGKKCKPHKITNTPMPKFKEFASNIKSSTPKQIENNSEMESPLMAIKSHCHKSVEKSSHSIHTPKLKKSISKPKKSKNTIKCAENLRCVDSSASNQQSTSKDTNKSFSSELLIPVKSPSLEGAISESLCSTPKLASSGSKLDSSSTSDSTPHKLSYNFESTLEHDLQKYKVYPDNLQIEECKLVLEDIMKRKRKRSEEVENILAERKCLVVLSQDDIKNYYEKVKSRVHENQSPNLEFDKTKENPLKRARQDKPKTEKTKKLSIQDILSKKSKKRGSKSKKTKKSINIEVAERFCCTFCGKKFQTSFTLQWHLKTHGADKEKQFKCEKCDYETDKRGYFLKHVNNHNSANRSNQKMKNPVECRICLRFMTSQNSLREHMKKMHADNVYKCDLCEKEYKQKHQFMRHLKDGHRFMFT